MPFRMRLGCTACEVTWTGLVGSACWCCGRASNTPGMTIDHLSIGGYHHMQHDRDEPPTGVVPWASAA